MHVIGISSGLKHGHHDGGAVLLTDGELIAAAEEERFTLAKHARAELPRGAIAYCLREAGIRIEEVDYVCSPLKTYPHYARRVADYMAFHFGSSPEVQLYDHHLCHAASTYFGSGYDEATVVCLDNSGDSSSGGVFHARGNDFREIARFERHNSLGLYYGMMTQFVGYQMTNDEYKVMGLASYGKPAYLDALGKILKPNGLSFVFDVDLDKRIGDREIYTTDFSTRQERIFTDKLEELLGPRRLAGTPIGARIRDVAASVQRQLEIVVTDLVGEAVARTGTGKLCLAGGVALNCKANMEILAMSAVERLYVPPAPHDAGVALGAAMLKCAEHNYPIAPLDHAFWGPAYEPAEIRATLDRVGASYEEQDDPAEAAARDLVEGRIVGWFQGRMEYGPRALGNRSILADPRDPGMKHRINSLIKYREEYRPFCPSVLLEEQEDYFDHAADAPFMNITSPAKALASEEVPAVIHVDGTARIQSVRYETNPLFHTLIERFRGPTGTPMVLNTSLNMNEQPMANVPLEALHTYFCSGMEVLYLGPFRLAKNRRA
jgi:carbamoyltransferase